MQRSSPSIGTLASALAKAQGELVNPEKSLVATIQRDGPKGNEQTFRYAPLSSGLDIVRKVLGQHEIATVQTTRASSTSRRSWRMPRANGSPPTGRSALSARPRHRIEWERH
jgi:hypothetical protein